MNPHHNIINLQSTHEEISHALANEPARTIIDPTLSSLELRQLIQLYSGQPHEDALLQLVATHTSTTEDLLLDITRSWGHDPGVLNAIATSPRVTLSVLQALEKTHLKSVRQHVFVGLLSHNLAKLSAAQMRKLLKRHKAERDVDIAVRLTFATSACTPSPILLDLLQDDIDLVAEAAQRELDRRKTDE